MNSKYKCFNCYNNMVNNLIGYKFSDYFGYFFLCLFSLFIGVYFFFCYKLFILSFFVCRFNVIDFVVNIFVFDFDKFNMKWRVC